MSKKANTADNKSSTASFNSSVATHKPTKRLRKNNIYKFKCDYL